MSELHKNDDFANMAGMVAVSGDTVSSEINAE